MKKLRAVLCALFGHSKVITVFWGYVSCGRCEAQIGDRLGGVFDTTGHVVAGHRCATCRDNFHALTWRDRLLTPSPFKEHA